MLGETARLATELTLKDGLSPGLGKSSAAVGRFDGKLGKAGKSVGAFTGKLKTAGAVAGGAVAGGLFLAVRSGLENLGELESATTSVGAALEQMGKSGKVSATQVADWANEIEAATQAAFDDKEITAATATLVRFGRVTASNIRPAMEVMTDLAAKTGSVESASSLLAKALADPQKAAAKLTRAGIKLTDAQQNQINKFVRAGKVGKAQALILKAIEKSTKGAAAAMNGPYVDAQRQLDDVVEDGTKLLATGFLPLLTKLSGKLRKSISDPKVMQGIKDFGEGLAGAFESAIDFAEKVPWGAIADGVKTSAQWVGRLFDAFRSMPPEAQAGLIALAGLNKLSGGAVTSVIGEIGKGLIKGVLGMNAGVVNINAGVVNGAGGAGGAAGAAGSVSKIGKIANAVKILGAVSIAGASIAALAQTFVSVNDQSTQIAQGLKESLDAGIKVKTPAELQLALDGVRQGIHDIESNPLNVIVSGDALATLRTMEADLLKQQGTLQGVEGAIVNGNVKQIGKLDRNYSLEQRSLTAFRAGERATLGVKSVAANKLAAANAKLDAIRHKKTSFKTTVQVGVKTNVSVRNVNNSNVTQNRYSTKTMNNAF